MMEKAQRLVKGISRLPTIPDISLRVSSLLQQQNIDLQKVADLILSDQVLTAQVIKIANSPLFKPLHEISSLRHALVYLGIRRINEIVFTCSLIKVFDTNDADFDIRTFWQHSFGVALMTEKLAHLFSFPDQEKAYTTGLVHDIGKVFMWSYLRHEWQQIIRVMKEHPCSFVDAEKRIMGTTHCEIGLCLAQNWNFPEEYCDAIAWHHAPATANRNQNLVALINLADSFFASSEELTEDDENRGSEYDLHAAASWSILRNATPGLIGFNLDTFTEEMKELRPQLQTLVNDLFAGR